MLRYRMSIVLLALVFGLVTTNPVRAQDATPPATPGVTGPTTETLLDTTTEALPAGHAIVAVDRWRQVTRVRPDEATGWLSLAEAQLQAGDKAGARATIDAVLARTWEERFGDVKEKAAALLPRTN